MIYKNNILLYSYFLEIRYRLFYLVFSFCITFLIAYFYSFELIFFIVQPFFAPKSFIFTDLTEAFSTTIYVCFLITIHSVIPLFLYQAWCFIIPGIFKKERKKLTILIFSICLILLIEIVFIFLFVLPEIIMMLFSFEIKKVILSIQLEARIQSYIQFIFNFYIYSLFFLQIPFLFFFFFKYNIINLKNGSIYRKYFFFCFLLCGALLSPPDIVYQLIIAFFFVLLYEFSLWGGYLFRTKQEKLTNFKTKGYNQEINKE